MRKNRFNFYFIFCFISSIFLLSPPNSFARNDEVSRRQQQILFELSILKEFNPAFFEGRDKIKDILPNEKYADILFLAALYCNNDVNRIKKEFPTLYSIFKPVLIEDFDGDKDTEILADMTSYWGDEHTHIFLYDRIQEGVKLYQQTVEGYRDNRKVSSINLEENNSKEILITYRSSKAVGVTPENYVLRIGKTTQIIFQFAGNEFKIFSPLVSIYDYVQPTIKDKDIVEKFINISY